MTKAVLGYEVGSLLLNLCKMQYQGRRTIVISYLHSAASIDAISTLFQYGIINTQYDNINV
jgi:hypothetical protein